MNCENCREVFQSWLPQNFPKVTYGFISCTPSKLSKNPEDDDSTKEILLVAFNGSNSEIQSTN